MKKSVWVVGGYSAQPECPYKQRPVSGGASVWKVEEEGKGWAREKVEASGGATIPNRVELIKGSQEESRGGMEAKQKRKWRRVEGR